MKTITIEGERELIGRMKVRIERHIQDPTTTIASRAIMFYLQPTTQDDPLHLTPRVTYPDDIVPDKKCHVEFESKLRGAVGDITPTAEFVELTSEGPCDKQGGLRLQVAA